MTEIEQVLWNLLSEVDDICKKYNIEYFLHESTGLSAVNFQSLVEEICHMEVCMRVPELLKFMDAFEKEHPEGRSLESWMTNSHYSSFSVRYVNDNTLFLDLVHDYAYQHYGLGVRILPLRDFPKLHVASRLATVKELGWEMTYSEGHPEKGRKAEFSKKFVEKRIQKIGRDAYAKQLFREFCRVYSNPKANMCFTRHFRTRRYHYETAWFREKHTAMLEGREFPVPAPEYFRKRYGDYWQEMIPSGRHATAWVVADGTIPYREYLQTAEREGCSLESFQKQHNKFNDMQRKGQDKIDTIHHYWDLLFRTGDRYDLWELYEPIKDKILQLRREERFDELETLLRPYRELLYKNYKLKLGLCFDPEIFDCMMDVLRHLGHEEYAGKLEALVPPEHKKPITILDYNGDPLPGPYKIDPLKAERREALLKKVVRGNAPPDAKEPDNIESGDPKDSDFREETE